MTSFPSKFDEASLYFKFVGSASGSKLTFTGAGGGCPSNGTFESSAMMDLRLFWAVRSVLGSDALFEVVMGPLTSLTDSAEASIVSGGNWN